MCSRYELKISLKDLPWQLKLNMPKGFKDNYEEQALIKPSDPVIVVKQEEQKISTSFMLWGLIAEWSKDPINSPKPFNARGETLDTKAFFSTSWKHRRCLLPASGFFEQGYRIRTKDCKHFWLAGLWNKWLGADGSEIESCAIITTHPNALLRPIHNRMPVIIPNGLEAKWLNQADKIGLLELKKLLGEWHPKGWVAEPLQPKIQKKQLMV